jgi:hypothetical protein
MLLTDTLDAALPSPEMTRRALMVLAEQLEVDECWLYERAYHFTLSDGWSIVLSAESAGRFRVELRRWLRPVSTLWTLAGEDRRLAGIVLHLLNRTGGVLGENDDLRQRGPEPLQ